MTEVEALEWAIWLIDTTAVMKADWTKKSQCLATLKALLAEKKTHAPA